MTQAIKPVPLLLVKWIGWNSTAGEALKRWWAEKYTCHVHVAAANKTTSANSSTVLLAQRADVGSKAPSAGLMASFTVHDDDQSVY